MFLKVKVWLLSCALLVKSLLRLSRSNTRPVALSLLLILSILLRGESRIVMEHTGRYYEVLAHQLSGANLFVSAITPKLIKGFDNDSLRKVKSDKADAIKIARYALDKWQNLKQYSVMDEVRNQLKTMPQDNPVYRFLDKKRSQGKPYYVYMTAGANKFLRIYYGWVKEYLSSLPESE